jgi:hypothetical protein
MNLINATNMTAGYAIGVRPDGRELLVVVVKATFTIPESGRQPTLADKQAPLIMTDVFTGDPASSAPLYEIDFAPRKPRCDVLLNGSAYPPGGVPADRVTVSLQVGSLRKSFDVVGNRVWTSGLLLSSPGKPEPFAVMPISYDNAFGGIDKTRDNPQEHRWYLPNHVGRGYYYHASPKTIEGKPLPNTEETEKRITKPDGDYRPMAFGPIGRAWKQRVQYAGTYDKQWLDNVFPFLPKDFQDEYYQAGPADQWTDYPQGGEEVELINLTPAGRTAFSLPTIDVPFEFFRAGGDRIAMKGAIDTVLLEPDLGRFTMSWRCALPLKKNIHEMRCAVVGTQSPRWYEDEGLIAPRAPGKQRFESLDELINANKQPTLEGG